MVFDGARFRISPRSIEGNGIIAKLEYIPKTEIESRSSDLGRLFKKKISKCWNLCALINNFHGFNSCQTLDQIAEKFFKRKTVLAVLAVVLIIKLIKIKLFWLLPLLVITLKEFVIHFVNDTFPQVGVGTAKKLVLKFLLFLFPALAHVNFIHDLTFSVQNLSSNYTSRIVF